MVQKKSSCHTISATLIAVIMLFFVWDVAFAKTHQNGSTIKNNPFPIDLTIEIGGPKAPFDRLLGALLNESRQSENKLQRLWEGVPDLIPDLYKVFISL